MSIINWRSSLDSFTKSDIFKFFKSDGELMLFNIDVVISDKFCEFFNYSTNVVKNVVITYNIVDMLMKKIKFVVDINIYSKYD